MSWVNARQQTVLVVEDVADQRDLLRRTLQRAGFSVRMASDGIEALVQLQTQTPDLVLLDLMLPKLDGFELLETIRQSSQWRQLPVLVFTALSDASLDRLHEYGVQAIARKGTTQLRELVGLVSKTLDQSAA